MGMYMKYGTIEGDATQQGFEGWINIHKFDWSLVRHLHPDQVGRAFNREAAQADVKSIIIEKEVDNSSGALLEAASTGFRGEQCEIVFLRTGNPGETYLKFTLENTLVEELSLSGGESERPTETITLDFTSLDIAVQVLDEANVVADTMHITYDIATGIGS